MTNKKESIGILGLGRFGKVLSEILKNDFTIYGYDISSKDNASYIHSVSYEELLQKETIFIATPIREFEAVIKNMAEHLKNGTTIIDVCSVKSYPTKIMQEYLSDSINIIATHPMFGPDSINSNTELKIVMHNVRDHHHCYDKWKNYFTKKQFQVIEMTPDEHDRFAAYSQGIAHLTGRVLGDIPIKSTPIDTLGSQKLLELTEQTCNDSWELFADLQKYNPYSKEMMIKLEAAFKHIRSSLKNSN